MKKVEMISAMAVMLFQMKPMILKSGFAKTVELGGSQEDLAEVHMDHVREGYKWLLTVYETEYKSVMEIRKLLPEETWDRYERWGGFDEHREVVLLKERLAVLKKAMTMSKRPNIFKKTKVEKWLRVTGNKTKNSVSKQSTKE